MLRAERPLQRLQRPAAVRPGAGQVPGDAGAIKDVVARFEQAGCDEFVLFPTASDPAQVDLLAEAVL